jgi:DNA modification methylase
MEKRKHELKIQYVKTEEIIPYENNARDHSGSTEEVKESMARFDFNNPIRVDENMVIIAGHNRLKAAKALGLEEVPVIVIDWLTPKQVQTLRLVDNKTAEGSAWISEKLKQEMQDIGEDLSMFGFEELEQYLDPELTEDDFELGEIDMQGETTVQPGQLWALGEHRLLCGDATKAEDIERLMQGRQADLLLTDPPYNVAYEGKTADALTIQNDNMGNAQFVQFLTDAFRVSKDNLKPGGAFYIWHSGSNKYQFLQALEAVGLETRQVLIWVKNTIILGRQDYQWKHEPCLYGWKDGGAHFFISDRSRPTVAEDRPNYKKMSKDQLIEVIKELEESGPHTTVIRENKPTVSDLHPTMKPIKLIGRQIFNSTRKGELVLDTFGGSGSTLLAAEQIGRICYTSELDPKYCDAIIKRWEEYTGQKAELLEE